MLSRLIEEAYINHIRRTRELQEFDMSDISDYVNQAKNGFENDVYKPLHHIYTNTMNGLTPENIKKAGEQVSASYHGLVGAMSGKDAQNINLNHIMSTDNANNIHNNADNIHSNAVGLKLHQQEIGANQAAIGQNSQDINQNRQDITQNQRGINQVRAQGAQNADNIYSNKKYIDSVNGTANLNRQHIKYNDMATAGLAAAGAAGLGYNAYKNKQLQNRINQLGTQARGY